MSRLLNAGFSRLKKSKCFRGFMIFMFLFGGYIKIAEFYNQEKYVESEIEYRKAVDANPDSPLAKESDVCLSTGHPDEVCALGMTPTTSTTVMTVIGDILVVETMKRTGFTIEDYSKRHHGGYLGEKSRSLCEK